MNVHIAKLKEKNKALRRELKLARKELARRLEELNGEAGRLAAMHAVTVSRELFDSRLGEVFQRIEKVEGNMREGAGRMFWPTIAATAVVTGLAVWFVSRLVKGS